MSYQTKQNSTVVIATEVTMGTIATNDATRIVMPVTDYSFSDVKKHSLSMAPARVGAGSYNMSNDMVKWQEHDRMFDISLTFHATAQSINRICLALFGDGDGANALLGSSPTVTSYSDAGTNAVPVTIWFENGAHAGLNTDISFTSCMCTGLTMTGDISSNGSVVLCTATFQTGYVPSEATKTFSGGTETTLAAQNTLFAMHDLATTQLNAQDLILYGFELNISRPVNKIGFVKANDYKPVGYGIMPYEVTGSLTCKRDAASLAAIGTTSGVALNLDTTVFQITGEKVFVDEAGISYDDDGWKQTIPLRFTYDSASGDNPVVNINTQA